MGTNGSLYRFGPPDRKVLNQRTFNPVLVRVFRRFADPGHPRGGLDFRRPVFRSLTERIGNRGLGLPLVARKDRLCRFGFDWFEYFADTHGCGIRVVNQPSLSPQAELVEAPMTIVHTFSCRRYGLRRYRKQIREAADG